MRAWLETRPRALQDDVSPEGLNRAKIDVLLEAYTGPIRLLSGYRESIPLWLSHLITLRMDYIVPIDFAHQMGVIQTAHLGLATRQALFGLVSEAQSHNQN
jgi:hypothetical protein